MSADLLADLGRPRRPQRGADGDDLFADSGPRGDDAGGVASAGSTGIGGAPAADALGVPPASIPSLDDLGLGSAAVRARRSQQSLAGLSYALGIDELDKLMKSGLNLGELAAKSPATSETMADPTVAEAAGPDWERLSLIERMAGDVRQRFRRGQAQVKLGQLGADALFDSNADPFRERSIQRLQSRLGRLNRDFGLPDEGVSGFFIGVPGAVAEMTPQLLETTGASAVGAVVGAPVGAALGAPAGGVGAIPGAIGGAGIGARSAASIAMFKAEAGLAYVELRDITGPGGEAVNPDLARSLAVGVGVFNAALESLGLTKLLEDVPGASRIFNTFGVQGAKRVLQGGLLQRIGVGGLKGATTEGVTEALQQATAIGAELVAHLEAGNDFDAFTMQAANGEVLRGSDAVWGRILSSLKQGAQAGTGLGAGASTVRAIADSRAVDTAKQNVLWLASVSDTAIDSELRKRNPEAFHGFVERATDGGQETVEIDGDAIHGWLNEATPSEARDMLERVEAFRTQAEEVTHGGGSYRVPMADYLTHVAPTGLRPVAEQASRLTPEQLTQEEAEALGDTDALLADAFNEDRRRLELGEALGALREGRRPVRDNLPDRPVQRLLRDLGGVDPESALGQAMLALDIPRSGRGSIQGLFRDGGIGDADQVVVSESERLSEALGADAELVTDQLLAFVEQELAGEPVLNAQEQQELVDEDTTFGELLRALDDSGLTVEGNTDAEILNALVPAPTQVDFVTGQPLVDGEDGAPPTADQIVELRNEAQAAAGLAPEPFSTVQQQAQRAVDARRVRDLSPHYHQVQARRRGREAFEASQLGEVERAAVLRRRELFHAFAEAASRRAKAQAEAAARVFAQVQTRSARERIGKAGADYLAQMDALLSRFDLRLGTTQRQIDRRLSLREWILDQEGEGETVIIPSALRDEAFTRSWKSLTVSELNDLKDSVQNIAHIASRKTKLILAREEAEMDERRFDLIEAAAKNLKGRKKSRNATKTLTEKVGEWAHGADAAMRKVEFVVDLLDGGDPNGVWRRTVFTPLAEAEAERNDLNAVYTQAFAQLANELMRGKRDRYETGLVVPELRQSDGVDTYTRQNLLAIALNLGNESNMAKLIDGHGWEAESVQAALDRELTKADWQFVQSTWDLIESLWPRISEQQKKLVGVEPPKVAPREFENAHGSFRGGYYPVVYDPTRSRFAFKYAEKRALFDNVQAAFKSAVTGHGFTIERTEVAAPLILDLKVIPGHLDQVIHDLTHRDPVMQIDRLLENPEVHSVVAETLGPKFAELFRPWLQGIATDRMVEDRGLSAFSRVFNSARRNLTTYTLGLRTMTLVAQVSGFSNGVAVLKDRLPNTRRHILKGMHAAFAGGDALNMQRKWEQVAEVSGEMRHRIGQVDKDQRDALRKAVMGASTLDRSRQAAMQLIGKVQLFAVDLPIWHAAYEGGQVEHGMDHRQAVEFADSIVRMSQASAGAKDLSQVQQSDEGWRSLLLFFTWRNTLYNQLAGKYSSLRRGKGKSSFADMVSSTVLMTTLPAVYMGLLRGAFEEDEDVFEMAATLVQLNASEALGSLPFVDFGSAVGGRSFSSAVPAQRLVNEFGGVVSDIDGVLSGEEANAERELLFSVMRLAGMATGAPVSAPLKHLEEIVKENDR